MASTPVRMRLQWSVTAGESRPIASALQGLMVSTRAEHGCVGCSLSTDMGPRVVIRYTEEWETEEDLRRQVQSDRFAVLAELMEHASEVPTIEFLLRDSTQGIEYAEQIRNIKQS